MDVAQTFAKPFCFYQGVFTWLILVESSVMLRRFSSLILALMLGGSVLAGTARLHKEHVCEMAGMEMMPGMDTMPCCKKDAAQLVANETNSSEQCCVTIPQETGSSGTAFKLRPPSFSIAVIHPAVAQSPLPAPKPYACPYSTQVFSPDLQASYIRNLSLLI
jgi:hypothetical protein